MTTTDDPTTYMGPSGTTPDGQPIRPGATAELPAGGSRSDRPSDPDRCDQCGTRLQQDQEWCLECGSSRTLIHRPPDWRVPIAVVAGIVVLTLAAFGFALIRLTDSSNRATAIPARSSAAPATQAHNGTNRSAAKRQSAGHSKPTTAGAISTTTAPSRATPRTGSTAGTSPTGATSPGPATTTPGTSAGSTGATATSGAAGTSTGAGTSASGVRTAPITVNPNR